MAGNAQAVAITLSLWLAAATLAAQPKPPATGSSSLSGRVTDQRTQQPLAGVVILLFDYDRKTETKTTTDAEGHYAFSKIAAGSYHVRAAHSGYVAQQHGIPEPSVSSIATPEGLVAVPAARHVADIHFQLVKGATIRGHITDPEGQPVEGASVSSTMVVGPNQYRYAPSLGVQRDNRSSKTGEFVLEGLAAGFYQISAMPPPGKDARDPLSSEFLPTSYPGVPRNDQAVAIRVEGEQLLSGIDFPLLRSNLLSISGQVIRTEHDGRIEGYVVAGLLMRNLGIDSAGAFRAGGLKPGRYTLWVRAKTVNGFEAGWETVDAFTDVPSLQLAMSPTATIAGRVMTVDGAPLPIEGFRVAAAWTSEGKDIDPIARDQTEVAADGTFEIAGVFGDRSIRLIGLPAGWEIDRIAAPKRDTDPFRLGPGERVEVIIVIARTAIQGRVTTPEGQPLAGARVTATRQDALDEPADTGPATPTITTPTGTKETGEFALRGLADGLYVLEARVHMPRDPQSGLLLPGEPEFQPTYYPGVGREQAVAVRVARGEVVSNITIPLARNTLSSVVGQVVRRDGDGKIDAHLLAPGSADQAVPLEPDGRFTIKGLKPGRHTLWARAATATGLEAAWAIVDVAAEVVEVELTLAPAATISGRIVASDGIQPAFANVRVAGVWTHEGQDVDVVWRDQSDVDDDGRFQLEGMFGERTLRVIGLPDGWNIDRIVQGGRPATTVKLSSGTQADVTIVVSR
jgi:hypothetical protein